MTDTKTILPTIGPDARTPEWYALRKYDPDRDRAVVFGASESAAVCGENPYQTPLELYLMKRGELAPEDDNEAMRMGRRFEPVVLDEYQFRTNCALRRNVPLYFHGSRSYMAATPDALRIKTDGPGYECAVDAKTTTYRMFSKSGVEDETKFGLEGTDQIPVYYLFQAQQQIEVMQVERVEFPTLFDTRTLRTYVVWRNDDLIDAIVDAECEMTERIVNDDPPPPNWEHPNTRKALQRLHGWSEDVVNIEPHIELRWNHYVALGKQIKDISKHREALLNRVLDSMGSAGKGRLSTGRFVKRIPVGPCTYTATREAYEMVREVKGD